MASICITVLIIAGLTFTEDLKSSSVLWHSSVPDDATVLCTVLPSRVDQRETAAGSAAASHKNGVLLSETKFFP